MENPSSKQKMKPHAILVSLPLQGHIIPTIQLAIKLASKGFSITFINAENIHRQITQSNPSHHHHHDIFEGIELDIEYLTVSDGLPLEYDRSLNHDEWLVALKHCYRAHVEVAIDKILKSRPLVRVKCLIADSYTTWASTVAKKFGLLHVSFWTEAALVLDVYFHRQLLFQNGHMGPDGRKDTICYIPGVKSLNVTDLTSYLRGEDLSVISHKFIFESLDDTKRADFVLANTVQELEIEAISAIEAQNPFYAIGPLFSPSRFSRSPIATSLWTESDCSRWLDTKSVGSVLYVSFGSYAHITKEELWEIANGIKLSGVSFVWVVRPDMVSSDDLDPLPVGFKDEVCDRGMVIAWTCQTEVLSHRAVGGFLTHCGWNSILESIWCEIPMLCFPLLTDQFTNRKLVVDDWKIGYNLCENERVMKEEVAQKIQFLLSDLKAYEIKEKIKEIRHILQNAVTMGGSSEKNLETFFEDLNVASSEKLKSSDIPLVNGSLVK